MILEVYLPCSSKESGLNPERKLLPGSAMVVEVEATGRRSLKAGLTMLSVNCRSGEQKVDCPLQWERERT